MAPAASPVPVVLPAGAVPAEVVGVTDGDTLTAIVDGRQIKVRLNGIDAPKKMQAFGNASKRALSDLVFGQRVSIVPLSKDRWGRTIAEVFTVCPRCTGFGASAREGRCFRTIIKATLTSANR